MALIVLPYVFSAGNTIIASQHNSNFQTIYNDYNGNITAANIASNAAIEYSQLSLGNSIKQTDLISTFNSLSGVGVIPPGGIIFWSGSVASIPTGFFLCNGSNGTPDLQDLFVIGAGNTYAVGTTGGSTTIAQGNLPAITLSFNTNNQTPGSSGAIVQANANAAITGSQSTSTLGSGSPYLQPYYALAYIMKS